MKSAWQSLLMDELKGDQISEEAEFCAFFLIRCAVFLVPRSHAKSVCLHPAASAWPDPAFHAAADDRGVDDAGLAPPRPRDQSRPVGGHLRVSDPLDAADSAGGDRTDRVFC